MRVREWLSSCCFRFVHQHNLVYNTCWEDPRLDRQALELGPDDTLAMITSAGCNALDYALLEPRRIFCIDVNPRQNALLELKIAGIRRLEYPQFFALFSRGQLTEAPKLYRQLLRPILSQPARQYWDRNIRFFCGNGARRSFYFRGTSGWLAYLANKYIDHYARIRDAFATLLAARTVEEQRDIYDRSIHGPFWTRFARWAMGKDSTLALLGVPLPQRLQVERDYSGGISQFIQDRLEAVFTRIPLHDNYFWRVYLTGQYSPECCPEYLKEENFHKLRSGLTERIQLYTGSLLEFFEKYPGQISRFVLLDHMDWLSTRPQLLAQQWQALVKRAAPSTRILWRSGALKVDYVDPIRVRVQGRQRYLGDLLNYHQSWADELHQMDRVNTYGSFYIADLMAA
jgi:S-adenosylmethionine-diacylglycerol 3-amino-3-carboxypropyl transferase